MLSEVEHFAGETAKYYQCEPNEPIVMLNDVKHLHQVAMRCDEMLHFVQHDMVFIDVLLPVIF